MTIVPMTILMALKDSAKKISAARWSARSCPTATNGTMRPTMSVKIIRARKLTAREIRIVLDRPFAENKSVTRLSVFPPLTVVPMNTVPTTNAHP